MSYRVIHGDCQDELKKLIEEEIQVDSIVTDPPTKESTEELPGNLCAKCPYKEGV
jgi:DNA modification methylase